MGIGVIGIDQTRPSTAVGRRAAAYWPLPSPALSPGSGERAQACVRGVSPESAELAEVGPLAVEVAVLVEFECQLYLRQLADAPPVVHRWCIRRSEGACGS